MQSPSDRSQTPQTPRTMRISNRILGATSALALCLLPASADRILRTDGSSIDGVTVTKDELKEVTYREDSRSRTIASDEVLRIEFDNYPKLVDEALGFAAEGALPDAADQLKLYTDGIVGGRKEKILWAPGFALQREIELRFSIGELEEAVAAADKLIKNFSDSRHVPAAYLAKAEALTYLDKGAAARATLQDFLTLCDTENLSDGLKLEGRLSTILADSALSGSKRKDKIEEIITAAGGRYPAVRNRARVALGQEHLAANSDAGFSEAQKIFNTVVDDGVGTSATLAAAYAGLGDCIYQEAFKASETGGDASAKYLEAIDAYLRVVVMHVDQSQYRPRALHFAAKCYDQIEGDLAVERARKLRGILRFEYPGWTL